MGGDVIVHRFLRPPRSMRAIFLIITVAFIVPRSANGLINGQEGNRYSSGKM